MFLLIHIYAICIKVRCRYSGVLECNVNVIFRFTFSPSYIVQSHAHCGKFSFGLFYSRKGPYMNFSLSDYKNIDKFIKNVFFYYFIGYFIFLTKAPFLSHLRLFW